MKNPLCQMYPLTNGVRSRIMWTIFFEGAASFAPAFIGMIKGVYP